MQKAQGKRRWSGIPELTLHDKDGNDVATIGQSNVCLTLIGMMVYIISNFTVHCQQLTGST